MKIAVSNPSVAPHVQQTVMAYHDAGYLEKFYTSFLDHPDNYISSFLKKFGPVAKEVQRRSFHQLPIEKFATRPFPELIRSLSARKLGPVITDKIWEWAELSFDRWVADQLTSAIDVVHTYEHAALATLKKASELNLFSVYEQPSQHHTFFSTIAKQQIVLYPELSSASSELLVNKKADKRNKRRDEELSLASLVLCNSTFTQKTLVAGGVDTGRISIIPLSFPPVADITRLQSNHKPMVFLYAGNQSLRKAAHILYRAWRECNFTASEAELWLIGKMVLPEHLRSDLPGKVIIKENIPHSELMELYKKANVFVLPTLADGFGMVVTEAMSQGLPVIASENSCGPDIINHMKDGWIIPAANVDVLAKQMQWCVAHPSEVALFGNAAMQKAKGYQWAQYRQKLAETVFDKWQQFRQAKLSV
ncbi:glycosyltransferase family 4 protein [Mucilaginibacter sp.]|uniref:glycosyltransferase family 4 protein n=1 Tax=Mucilaginibacter sp. TaxID=1882438 RepID=UPI002611560C|nr:glycosyltransferase family 4 protein [Mucilaginibacter sp.]MDB4927009.1 glycosyltransferase family 4 protein [Mucilaginibacter sp.]